MSAFLLVTGPEVVEADVVAATEAAAGAASAPRRLGPGGVEMLLDDGAGDEALSAARAALTGRAVDVNLVPAAGRVKHLLIADMDSTIIEVECIDEIADFAGKKADVAAITEAAMRGALDFEAALTARVALLADLPLSALEAAHAQRVRLSPGAATLTATMRGWGAETALVSGGFTFFAEKVAKAAGFARFQANVLEFDGDRLSGRVLPPILGRDAKRAALEAICAERGIAPDAALAVGDGANDLAMIGRAGLGVAYRAKPVTAAAADARLDHSDLTALLHLQGVAERDFAFPEGASGRRPRQ